MGGLLRTLLVVWLLVAVVGLLVKGMFWLFVVGAVLLVATGLVGMARQRR